MDIRVQLSHCRPADSRLSSLCLHLSLEAVVLLIPDAVALGANVAGRRMLGSTDLPAIFSRTIQSNYTDGNNVYLQPVALRSNPIF
jgi:hypothetical protein